MYNMGSAVETLTGAVAFEAAPGLRSDLEQVGWLGVGVGLGLGLGVGVSVGLGLG